MRTSSRRAPELLQAGVAAAAKAVTLVASGALFVAVLVILLGGIGRRRRDRPRHDLSLETRLLFELAFGGFGGVPLRVVQVEDRRAVLVSVVAELSAALQRVHVVPEDLQQLLVGDLRGVERDLDRLRMPRRSGGDFL